MDTQNNRVLYICTACGAKFSPDTTGGVCPYCRTAHGQLIQTQRNRYRKQQARKKQLKTAAVRLSVALVILIVLIVGICSLVSNILRGNEVLLYATEELSDSPFFYTDSDGMAYVLGSDGNGILIGKGRIGDFCSSEKKKLTYFVFEGSRDPDALGSNSELLLSVDASGTIRSIAEYPYGTVSFVQGGNCDYLYYVINETLSSYQTASRLYLYKTGDKAPKKIAEFSTANGFDNFRVSPNGHYLLYKAQDDGGSKLMRYSVKSGSSESLGIKNAEPISVDNKGTYYSYLRRNDGGMLDFYVESGVSDREKIELGFSTVDRISVAADGRSFLIENGNLTVIKVIGTDAVTIAARTGSGIGIRRYPTLSSDGEAFEISGVHTLCATENKSFFPYYYFNYEANGNKTLYCCEKDGTKRAILDHSVGDFVTNGVNAAYIDDHSLYTLVTDKGQSTPTLVSENFDSYTLHAVSENGKFIYYRDVDGNLYRIPFDYMGRDWLKIAVDADPIVLSSDGRKTVYFSDGALYAGKDDESYKIADAVSASDTYVTSDLKTVVYLAESENSKAQDSRSLYRYDGKKSVLIADNVTSLTAYSHRAANYLDIPYSSYVETPPTDLSAQTDNTTGTNVQEAN